jgi:hypothetical protein
MKFARTWNRWDEPQRRRLITNMVEKIVEDAIRANPEDPQKAREAMRTAIWARSNDRRSIAVGLGHRMCEIGEERLGWWFESSDAA